MRYFLGFLVAIGLIILIIFLMFSGGGKPKTLVTPKTLDSYAVDTNAAVQLIIDGSINADQNHAEIQITIGSGAVVYEQIQGYQGTVVNQQSFANNQSAFAVLLHALDYAGFTKGDTAKDLSDERGYCALGDRYIFSLTDNGNDVERYWATSCGNPKTYFGNLNLTLSLFEAQVPNYGQLTNGVNL
jgi:hypothetical protein